jgi:hypothetical protein
VIRPPIVGRPSGHPGRFSAAFLAAVRSRVRRNLPTGHELCLDAGLAPGFLAPTKRIHRTHSADGQGGEVLPGTILARRYYIFALFRVVSPGLASAEDVM